MGGVVDAFALGLGETLLFSADNPLTGDGQTLGPEQLLLIQYKSTASWLGSWLLGCLSADWDPQQTEETPLSPAWDPGLTHNEIVKCMGDQMVEQLLRHRSGGVVSLLLEVSWL